MDRLASGLLNPTLTLVGVDVVGMLYSTKSATASDIESVDSVITPFSPITTYELSVGVFENEVIEPLLSKAFLIFAFCASVTDTPSIFKISKISS